jgi:hypothetical protein
VVIDDILPANGFLGASLILRQGGRFLFGIRPLKYIQGQAILEITGIGGKLEADDANLTAGVQREACEEISVFVRILPCERTLIVRGWQDIQEITLSGDEQPAALVFRHHHTPPHQPWRPGEREDGCIAVFLAELVDPPLPSAEIPYLVWLQPAQILALAQADLSLGELMKDGAELVSASGSLPQPSTTIRLTDSQEALVLALGQQALDYYQAFL